jgi:hypothetical protein
MMGMSDWLLVASLGASLFVILSQIGVIRRMNDVQEILELLMLNAILEAEVKKQKDEENNRDY